MKNYSLPLAIKQLVAQARQQDRVLVMATGVFDVLHQEHYNFLVKAKEVGDILIVGVETDERVRVIKGEGRPANSEKVRLHNLDQMGVADGVFLLPQNFDDPRDHRALMRLIRPNILAVSAHSPHLKEKRAVMETVGGELRIVHQHNPEISTSLLLKKEKKERNDR